jgi:hypothetical protein
MEQTLAIIKFALDFGDAQAGTHPDGRNGLQTVWREPSDTSSPEPATSGSVSLTVPCPVTSSGSNPPIVTDAESRQFTANTAGPPAGTVEP